MLVHFYVGTTLLCNQVLSTALKVGFELTINDARYRVLSINILSKRECNAYIIPV